MKGNKNRLAILAAISILTLTTLGGISLRLSSTGSQESLTTQPKSELGVGTSSVGGSKFEAKPWTDLPSGMMARSAETYGSSLALRDITAPVGTTPSRIEERREEIPSLGLPQADPVIQTAFHPFGALAPQAMPAPIVSFDGIGFQRGTPPDTTGEVGPNHYLAMVNAAVAVYSKSGATLVAPIEINELWREVGGPCFERNDGDPIALYDQLADRWLITQFTAQPPYHECIAVSKTSDPTAEYHVYAFFMSQTNFPDYPHFGVWPDAYYMGVNEFANGQTFVGSRPYAFERAKMLIGDPNARMITTSSARPNTSFLQPADLYGSTPPPAGAPNTFSEMTRSMNNVIRFYKFAVNWNSMTANFTGPTNVPVAGFTPLCGECIPQPGTTQQLDGIGDRLMYRAAYRNYGTHESLVLNHSVAANNFAGVRWYEMRNINTTPTVYQQGTYAPNDEAHRWMGSAAMDRSGNLAVGFSIVRTNDATRPDISPSIGYAGRLAGDPLGTLAQGEATLISGIGAQVGSYRWGDYSDLTVDPTDDCTFWYVNEYTQGTGSAVWQTRIGSFKFPTCGGTPPTPTPTRPPGTTPTPTRPPGASPTPTSSVPTPTPEPGTCTVQFSDVPAGSTFYTFVRCLSCQGIIGGYTDGTFRPNNVVTRGQLSKIVSNAAGYNEEPGSQSFSDVPPSNPFYAFVERMAGRGIIGGYTDGTFRPNNNATRGQISKIVSNAAGFNDEPGAQSFSDVPPSNPFYAFVERMASRGIIGGYSDGTFRPNNNATRGQVSKIVANAFGCQER